MSSQVQRRVDIVFFGIHAGLPIAEELHNKESVRLFFHKTKKYCNHGTFTHSTCPLYDALWRGVHPSLSALSTCALASNNTFAHSTNPLHAIRYSAVRP